MDVYVFIAEKCPISIYMANPLRDVVREFRNDVNFYAVFPMTNSTRISANQFLASNKLIDFEVILDDEQHFARQFGATITPEVVVVVNEEIKYRGRISNAYTAPGKMKHGKRTNDLFNVLEQIKLDPLSPMPFIQAVGCYITFHAVAK
jgi:peroxiredoxin